MKTKLLFSFVLVALLNSANAQLSWLPLSSAPKSYRLDDFHFINPNKGWAISPYYDYLTPNKQGQIWTTNDAGNSWHILIDSSKTFFRSIGFADSLVGWVGNLADSSVTTDTVPLYHTIDGGVTWNPVTNLPNPKPKGICGISVVTDSIIYAYGRYYGPPVLLKTIDKGNTWTSQDMSAYASGLVDAHFFNKDTGFVTGCYGYYPYGQQKALILSTFDGGVTWQVRHQSARMGEEVWKIAFPSRNIGYAAIEYQNVPPPNVQAYYLKTTDGGITWTDVPFLPAGTNYDIEGVGFINDTVGWIGGDNCLPTYKTTDGGITWNPDLSLGVRTSYYECSAGDHTGIAMNRFRKFGDTLMYGSGYTVCKLSGPVIPIPYFHASSVIVCAGSAVTFNDSTQNTKVTAWQWSFPGGTLVSGYNVTDSMPQVIYNTPGVYAVSYTASTTAGSASITKTAYISVVNSIAQFNTAFSEGFETDSVPGAFWNVSTTVSSNWMITSNASASGSKSVMINNLLNTPKDTSVLFSPSINLVVIGSPILEFSMAYQQQTTTNIDKLQVLSSIDCGATWVSRWVRSGSVLQPSSVSGQSSVPFVPTPSQFSTYTVNISPIASSTNAMFKWVFYSGTSSVGNNIYLDNINVYNSTSGIKKFESTNNIHVYPNPSNGILNITSSKNMDELKVTDMLGQLIYESNPKSTNTSFFIQNVGIYFISVICDKEISVKKIVVYK